MAWIYLCVAGLLEIGWAVGLIVPGGLSPNAYVARALHFIELSEPRLTPRPKRRGVPCRRLVRRLG